MAEMYPKFTAAAVQASPVLPMDRRATIDKLCALIEEAGRNGARLIVFPETFVPMYPNWSIDLSHPGDWTLHLRDLTDQAVEVPGPEMAEVGRAARSAGAYVCLGVNERVKRYAGVLYNTLVLIAPDGDVIGRHRKLLPSNREKVFWHRGDAPDLQAVWETPYGRIGGLICYEHLQPLFKYALIAQGEQVHCAAWPGWPDYPGWRSNRHVIDAASRAYALEGQCFVVVSSQIFSRGVGPRAGFTNASWTFFGGSGILNPAGEYLAGPIYEQETILYADLDLGMIPLRKAAIDTTGRDTRWDIVRLWMAKEKAGPFAGPGATPFDAALQPPSLTAWTPTEPAFYGQSVPALRPSPEPEEPEQEEGPAEWIEAWAQYEGRPEEA
ncbi:MAG: carbon-nitrogen hydrolase family protein [Bacteroidetes bacterium]|nr:carbon-nitrogen hydrolase family protein [Bacteroidota bacterium]